MNTHESGSGPIFIGGQARSGKTYMRFMLAAHPDIAASKRTNLWTQHYRRYGDLAVSRNFERCLASLLANKHVQSLHPDPDTIRRTFHSGPATYTRLFTILHESYAAGQGKPRWADQSEGIEWVTPLVLDSCPAACMIQMIRDPRDQYEALADRRPLNRWRIADSTACWKRSAQCAIQFSHLYPERYLVIRYESLVSRLPDVVETVCRFLGIEPVQSMALLGNAPRFGSPTLNASPLSTGFIGRFREYLAPHEIAYIQQRTYPYMQALGYIAEGPFPTRMDALRFRVLDGLAVALGNTHQNVATELSSSEAVP